MTEDEFDAAFGQAFNEAGDDLLGAGVTAQLDAGTPPGRLALPAGGLARAAMAGTAGLSLQNRKRAASEFSAGMDSGASDLTLPGAANLFENADLEQQEKAVADGVREKICGELREWFEGKIDAIKEWVTSLGLKAALEKMWDVAKTLGRSGWGALVTLLGSTWAAGLAVGVVLAGVGAAIWYLAKNGVPQYCSVD